VNDKSHPAWQKRRLGILCYALIIAVLIATLWPFNFFPANRVSWLSGTTGIRFANPGVVVGQAPLKMPGNDSAKPCSLELLLRPASLETSAVILNMYAPHNPDQFLLRQWTHGLVITQDVINEKKKLKRMQLDVDHTFRAGKLSLMTVTSGPNGTAVYLDGRPVGVFPKFTISQDTLSGQIVLGTAAEDDVPWSGELHGLAVYANELTALQVSQHFNNWISESDTTPDLGGAIAYYSFSERAGLEIHNRVAGEPNLEIPKWFDLPHKAVLKSIAREYKPNWEYLSDVLWNIVGFIPIGFLFSAYFDCTIRRWRAILYAILTGGMLSFAIELMQLCVPSRKSSMSDLVTNTLGAAIGALLARPSFVQTVLNVSKTISAPRGISGAVRD
jgi:VanZ family protein